MPIYEYKCSKCKKVFESIRPMEDADKTIPCPHCECKKTQRILSTCNCHSAGGTSKSSSSCGGCSSSNCGTCSH